MSKKSDVTRREFMNRSGKIAAGVGAAALAAPAIDVLGANDKIRIGVIGPGKRGRYLMGQTIRTAMQGDFPVEFVAVADIFEGWRDEGVKAAGPLAASEIKKYDHYKKLLEDKNVNTVIIATPEHQHAQQIIDAIAAGKDIYCEKPMVHTVKEGKAVAKAAKLSKCVIQIGTQRRSVPLFHKARELVKSGEIGQVTYCEGWWNRNSFVDKNPHGAWRYEIPDGAGKDNINWNEFYVPAPYTDFDLARYFQWRCYFEYSNGIGSDLMVHQIDAINCVMGTSMPKSVVSSGGIYRWKDGRSTPDTWSSILEYEDEGFQINYHSRFSNVQDHYGIKICGTLAQIVINLHHEMSITSEPEWVTGKPEKKYESETFSRTFMTANDEAVREHVKNWLECIQTRNQKTNCDAETGYHGAAIAAMAVQSYREEKKVKWDKEREVAFS